MMGKTEERKIYKYSLKAASAQLITMPCGAEIIHCAEQLGELTIWATVGDKEEEPVERLIRIIGTGHTMPSGELNHIATVLMEDGFVWHVFEEVSNGGN